ncbi:hypothetical protein [Streptacidiphilus neutrinimicus]|uniref:hypothetical protein n=1 Tax=Streptacidiphilus neutrinimicus TaxID=105420 RepID=UPI0005A64712|nr:hypothetical protein [Streptacidiphilus neutrinimicus]
MPTRGPDCTDPAAALARPLSLASSLRPMLPGALTLRLVDAGPEGGWTATALMWGARPQALRPATAETVVAWVRADYPHADWSRPHEVDLTTGQLLCVCATSGEA